MSHPSFHNITTIEGHVFNVISTHHQLQYPFNLPEDEYFIIGWAENISKYHHLNPTINLPDIGKEPEIVYYPKTNSLAFQTHLERLEKNSFAVKYANTLLEKFLNNKITRNIPLQK